MTGNSLEGLLAWMQDCSQLQEWDALLVLSAERVNQGLQQEYAVRLSRGQTWQPPTMRVDIPETDYSHYLDAMVLGPPVFTLERASLDSAEVQLRVPVLGGSDMLVTTHYGNRVIVRLSSWSPLYSPQLHLALRPEGSIDAQGHLQLVLDPAQAEEVALEFVGTDFQKEEIGRQLLAWFKSEQPARRTWPVLSLGETSNPMLHGASVKLRTQANPAASATPGADRDGALLLFISMEHGQAGGIPGENSGFKYLLPDDQGPDCNATVLFASPLLHRAAMSAGVQGLLEQGQFAWEPASGPAQRMVSRGGSLPVPATQLSSDDLEFQCDPFAVQADASEQIMVLTFEPHGAQQTWQFSCAVPLRYRQKGESDWRSHCATFRVRSAFEFHLASQSDARLGMQGHLFTPRELSEECQHVSGLPNLSTKHVHQLEGLVALTVKRALLGRYSRSLRIDANQALLGASAVTGGLAIEPRVQALPYDQALFGRLTDSSNHWHIVERQPVIGAGATLQMTVEPAQQGLLWSVQNLPGGGGHAGSIDSNGLYRAPAAHELGSPNRSVVVIASDPASGAWHFSVVTVVGRTLSVEPLIQLCGPGDQVQLLARPVGGATLQWEIVDPQVPATGRLRPGAQGHSCTYTAPPQSADQAYALEQIRVIETQSGQSESVWMLTRLYEMTASIVLEPDPEPGTLQLRFIIGDQPQQAQWRLAADSPGRISEQGLYEADPAAAQAFALVFGSVTRLGRLAEQHIILPLPLEHYPTVLGELTQP